MRTRPSPARWLTLLRRGFGASCTVVVWAFVLLAMGPQPFRVLTLGIVGGTSMEPTLSTGDLVVAARWGEVTIGDVVVVESAGGFVVHRVVDGGEQTGWVTQGDANDFRDRFPVDPDAVLGEPVLVVPGVGLLTDWIHQRPLSAATCVTAAYLIVQLNRRSDHGHVDSAPSTRDPSQVRTKSSRSGDFVQAQ